MSTTASIIFIIIFIISLKIYIYYQLYLEKEKELDDGKPKLKSEYDRQRKIARKYTYDFAKKDLFDIKSYNFNMIFHNIKIFLGLALMAVISVLFFWLISTFLFL